MIGKLPKSINSRTYGMKTLTTVAFSFLMAGIFLAAGFNWTGSTAAQSSEAAPRPETEPPSVVPSFRSLAEKLTPSVVNVQVIMIEKAGMRHHHGRDQGMGHFDHFEDFDEHFDDGHGFGGHHGNQLIRGDGSGVIIGSDGVILTNNHVVEGAREVKVTLADGRELKAKVIGRDPKTDLAVLKINADNDLPAAPMGDSDSLQVGDWVLAVGNPFGLSESVTSGIVSAKGRIIGDGPYDNFIQTNVSINPGNSGGPLFDMNGELVGINSATVPYGQGIGFAVPINTAKPLIPQLMSKGKVTRGYIGVNFQGITPRIAAALKLGDRKGALVTDVVAGGPADEAGLKRGDLIVTFNGREVKSSHNLPAMIAAAPVGNEVSITVLRDGNEKVVQVRIAGPAYGRTASAEHHEHSEMDMGLILHDMTFKVSRRLGLRAGHGALVIDVEPGSSADEAGIRRGDLIIQVNRQDVESVEDVEEEVSRAPDEAPVLFLVQRGQEKIYVALAS